MTRILSGRPNSSSRQSRKNSRGLRGLRGWAAGHGKPPKQMVSFAAHPRNPRNPRLRTSTLPWPHLLPGDLEICLHVVVSPGSDNGPVIRPEIFDVPVNHIVNRFSRSVLRVCLEMDEPPLGLE